MGFCWVTSEKNVTHPVFSNMSRIHLRTSYFMLTVLSKIYATHTHTHTNHGVQTHKDDISSALVLLVLHTSGLNV
jgi:hypothetical protein